MPVDLADRPGILVGIDLLIGGDPDSPRPIDDAGVVLERLAWIGRPVILVGEAVLGRRLPESEAGRVAWALGTLPTDGLDVIPFVEARPERVDDGIDGEAVDAWTAVRAEFAATWLLTAHPSSIGPARRAHLGVIQIGPRTVDVPASVERADRRARDLLDAVSQLLTMETFGVPESS